MGWMGPRIQRIRAPIAYDSGSHPPDGRANAPDGRVHSTILPPNPLDASPHSAILVAHPAIWLAHL
jgi:hypothetical protein